MTTRIEIPDAKFVGPKYRLDRRHGDGTLLHLNPRHPAGRWAAGVPVDGSLLPNIARLEAIDLIGSGTPEAAVAASFRNNGFTLPADGYIERTAKGGLRIIVSKTAPAEHFFHIDWPALVAAHVQANPTDDLYMSLVGHVDRRGTTSPLARISSATGGVVRQMITEVTANGVPGSVITGSPTSGSTFLGRNFADSPGLFMVDGATSAAPANWPSGVGLNPILAIFGVLGAAFVNGSPDWVIYDLMVDNLTRSCRTYAEAHALTQDYVQREHLTPGGTYYQDTWTDRATALGS